MFSGLDFLRGVSGKSASPQIVGESRMTSATTSITINMPANFRQPGLLAILITVAVGSSPTPALPSGWTSIASIAGGATAPGARACFKFLDGLDEASFSQTVTGATGCAAVCYTIKGCTAARIPTGSLPSGSNSNTQDPPSLTPTVPSAGNLWIALGYIASDSVTVTQWPFGFCRNRQQVAGTGISLYTVALNRAIGTMDPSAFVWSASAQSKAGHIEVRA